MTISAIRRFSMAPVAALALCALALPATAEQVSREQDIVNLRLGQRIQVDDGSCPAGQIKEVAGAQMTSTGVVATRKCIPRLGTKKR
jgi:phosphosulfolactate phosphohydrolase-like enzyme